MTVGSRVLPSLSSSPGVWGPGSRLTLHQARRLASGPAAPQAPCPPEHLTSPFLAVELTISLATCGSQGPSWDSNGDQRLWKAPWLCARWRGPGEPVWQGGGRVPSPEPALGHVASGAFPNPTCKGRS